MLPLLGVPKFCGFWWLPHSKGFSIRPSVKKAWITFSAGKPPKAIVVQDRLDALVLDLRNEAMLLCLSDLYSDRAPAPSNYPSLLREFTITAITFVQDQKLQ